MSGIPLPVLLRLPMAMTAAAGAAGCFLAVWLSGQRGPDESRFGGVTRRS